MNDIKELIYVGDPMCSWCYGFSQIKKNLEDQCKGRARVRYLAGGLHTDWTNYWDQSYREFLRDHWLEIGKRSGQPFKFEILSREDFIYNTRASCCAVITAREIADDISCLDFFSTLQSAFYAENKDITNERVLIDLAVEFGFAKGKFTETFTSTDMKLKTDHDFLFARQLGVTGFPTVLLKDSSGYSRLTVGYQDYKHLEPIVEKWLSNHFKN